jgi:hypothetical protein
MALACRKSTCSSNAHNDIGGQVKPLREVDPPSAFKSTSSIVLARALWVAQKCRHGLEGICACIHQITSKITGQHKGWLNQKYDQKYDKHEYLHWNEAQCLQHLAEACYVMSLTPQES